MKTNKYLLIKKRQIEFRRLTGLTVEKFDELLTKLTPIYQEAESKRLYRNKRQRTKGGGRHKSLLLEEQLLLCLIYYRLYTTHFFLGLIFNIDESNVCRYINYLHPLLARIFRIPERRIDISEADLGKEKLIELFLDGTEQQIQRPKKKQKKYYSGKKKKHTLKNQIIVDKKKKILTLSKSNQGKKHDKKIYDETRAYSNHKVKKTGDLGYQGADGIDIPIKKPKGKKLTPEQKKYNRELSKRRIIVEHVFGKMKFFQILTQRFRNQRKYHTIIFKNIAGLYNFSYS